MDDDLRDRRRQGAPSRGRPRRSEARGRRAPEVLRQLCDELVGRQPAARTRRARSRGTGRPAANLPAYSSSSAWGSRSRARTCETRARLTPTAPARAARFRWTPASSSCCHSPASSKGCGRAAWRWGSLLVPSGERDPCDAGGVVRLREASAAVARSVAARASASCTSPSDPPTRVRTASNRGSNQPRRPCRRRGLLVSAPRCSSTGAVPAGTVAPHGSVRPSPNSSVQKCSGSTRCWDRASVRSSSGSCWPSSATGKVP